MTNKNKLPDESVEVKEEQQEVVSENLEEIVCHPEFSSGCIDVSDS